MGRPRQSGDSFSHSDLATASGLSRREVQHIVDEKLLPAGSGVRAFKRTAAIGALVAAGVSLMPAARMAKGLAQMEFDEADGELPSGLKYFARKLPDTETRALPRDANDYWYHAALYRHPTIYERGKPDPADVVIEIVDRELIFLTPLGGLPILNPATGEAAPFWFAAKIADWGRDSKVKYLTEMIGRMDDEENPGWRDTMKLITEQAHSARLNAIGRISVNVSLAVRRAFDRLAEDRAGHGKAAQ